VLLRARSGPPAAPVRLIAATLAVGALAACTGSTPGAALTTVPPPSGSSAAGSSAAARTTPDPSGLVLGADGLRIEGGGAVRRLPFGTSRSELGSALTAVLGPMAESTQADCAQGPLTQLDGQGLSVLFDGVQFVGWVDNGADGRHLTTGEGIGVDSPLDAVRSRYPDVQVMTGTLGPMFLARQGLSGFLDGTAPSSRVTTVYAGQTCFFRLPVGSPSATVR
jgi:hypothetical protein